MDNVKDGSYLGMNPLGDTIWPWYDCLATLLSLAVAFVFALAGFAKIHDPTSAIVFLKLGFDVPFDAAARLVLLIASVELILAGWFAFDLGRSLRPTVAGLALVGCFSGLLLAVAQANPRSTWTCGCFGALQPPWGGKTLVSHLKFDLLLAAALLCQAATWHFAKNRSKNGIASQAIQPR